MHSHPINIARNNNKQPYTTGRRKREFHSNTLVTSALAFTTLSADMIPKVEEQNRDMLFVAEGLWITFDLHFKKKKFGSVWHPFFCVSVTCSVLLSAAAKN